MDEKTRLKLLKAKLAVKKKKSSIPDEIMQEAADAAGQNKNLSPSYIAQDHKHSIVFKGHRLGGFRGASLNSQSGKFAKYWLLNAKETNGNGWGIAAHTAKDNMKKFIGRPLVVTAKSWHGASEYGEEYEHPYLPTNDISAILRHQDKFRVGSIVDVFEDKNGDWFANIEMLPKFANRTLPPFCSPAIYQLDAKENEGQISKWEALHLAALNENPAYGARIAILKGTCMGTGNECKVQFKAAKGPDKKKPSTFQRKLGTSRGFRESPGSRSNKYNPSSTNSQDNMLDLISKNAPKKQTKVVDSPNRKFYDDGGNEISRDEYNKQAKIICPKKLKRKVANLKKKQKISKVKARLKLATLGEQNMTYQDSKKVKIHKKKHPEVRKAKSSVEDILRGQGRSVDGSHAQSTFLSRAGDFIGGGDKTEAHRSQVGLLDDSELVNFQKETGLIRVQNFPINRAGDKKTSLGINSKVNNNQLKSIKDLEAGGQTIGFSVGDLGKETTGEGYRDLAKTLREKKFL